MNDNVSPKISFLYLSPDAFGIIGFLTTAGVLELFQECIEIVHIKS